MKINYALFCFIAVTVLNTAFLQAQSINNLEGNNGFKKYKLGSKFVMGYGVKIRDESGADKIIVDYSKDKIGDIPVKTIELYYIKDTLSRIVVRVPVEYYDRLSEACKNSFGMPNEDLSENENNQATKTSSGNNYRDLYIWKAKRFSMEYMYFYPKFNGGGNAVRDLYLDYSFNDYPLRLQTVKKGDYSAKNF